MKTVAIIGAGPAGLTAAYELLQNADQYRIVIYEKDYSVGGLSRSFEFGDNRVDIGGHRYFTKSAKVSALWDKILPESPHGMLICKRRSHVLYDEHLFEYPLTISWNFFKTLGFKKSRDILVSYLYSRVHKEPERTLENYYINHFGRELYSIFFRNYTRKVWGVPANHISADWGSQRIKDVSTGSLIKDNFLVNDTKNTVKRSLIKSFKYPALGSGQLWDLLAEKIFKNGGEIVYGTEITELKYSGSKVSELICCKNGESSRVTADWIISSMPLSDLVLRCKHSPMEIRDIADKLYYRDMIIVAVKVPKNLIGERFAECRYDNWIYVQDHEVRLGRLQILNNWSRFSTNRTSGYLLELEYYCNEDDPFWRKTDAQITDTAFKELRKCGFISRRPDASEDEIFVKRIKNAYPVYKDGYYCLEAIRTWLDGIDNLLCIGRNGQHHYNNMDHSMETAFAAADYILGKYSDRQKIWDVNTDSDYHEEDQRI